MKYSELNPRKIIYNGNATIVFWQDGTKTVVKRTKGTKDDKYSAFCAALAKKVFNTNSELKRKIKIAENTKRIKPEKKKKSIFEAKYFSNEVLFNGCSNCTNSVQDRCHDAYKPHSPNCGAYDSKIPFLW